MYTKRLVVNNHDEVSPHHITAKRCSASASNRPDVCEEFHELASPLCKKQKTQEKENQTDRQNESINWTPPTCIKVPCRKSTSSLNTSYSDSSANYKINSSQKYTALAFDTTETKSSDLSSRRLQQVSQTSTILKSSPVEVSSLQKTSQKVVPSQTVSKLHFASENVPPEGSFSDENDNFFGLPNKVKILLWANRSISDLYDWQKKCLSLEMKSSSSNFIYSFPTSGGKTLVAEILMIKQVVLKKKDVLFILPFVAIVQEKLRSLAPFGVDLNFLVEEYASAKGKLPPIRHSKNCIYVATIEKAASIVNSLIENKRIEELGLVVVDELHMIGGEGSRGACLETTLTKILFSSPSTQIIGMSATLSNIDELQLFLKAQLYTGDFRPVELKEYVKISDTLYEVNNRMDDGQNLEFSKLVSFKNLYNAETIKRDPDHLLGLVMEVAPDQSCLIFCSSKVNCQNVAQLLTDLMPSSLKSNHCKERKILMDCLKMDSEQICPILEKTLPYGVAYHHSGLTSEERKLIEEAFLEGVLCVLTCTSTLAAGVNLPAKRVILRSPYIGTQFLSRTKYKQMIGRAGRAGFHASGESVLVTNQKDAEKISSLIGGSYDKCQSSLLHEGRGGLSSVILSCIGLKITKDVHALSTFLKLTLCYKQSKKNNTAANLIEEANKCLEELVQCGFVTQKHSVEFDGTPQLDVTNLGRAVFKGPIDLSIGKKLYDDMNLNRSNLVLSSHLHLLYVVTPYKYAGQVKIDWMTYIREVSRLSKEEQQILDFLSISEAYLTKKAAGMTVRNTKNVNVEATERFYLTLILNLLLKRETVWDVAFRFQESRGFLQQLLNSCASFASCVLHFSKELDEMWSYQDLLPNFILKLSYCCSAELIPLLEIPGVKIGRARLIYKAGYRTPQQIARCTPDQLTHEVELMPKKIARLIIASAQMLVNQKVEELVEEVKSLVLIPSSNSQYAPDNSWLFNESLDFRDFSQF